MFDLLKSVKLDEAMTEPVLQKASKLFPQLRWESYEHDGVQYAVTKVGGEEIFLSSDGHYVLGDGCNDHDGYNAVGWLQRKIYSRTLEWDAAAGLRPRKELEAELDALRNASK